MRVRDRRSSVESSPIVLFALLVFAALPGSAEADCPATVRFEPTANGVLESGWTGIYHDVAILGPTLNLALDCPVSTPPCGTCPITGLDDSAAYPSRCLNDSSLTCTPATEVAVCGAAGRCRTFLGPPTSLGLGGLSYCMTAFVDGAVGGTVDVESGAFAPVVPILTEMRSGVGGVPGGPFQGCPRCVGDPVPNDALRAGTCDAGPRAGLGCDVNDVSDVPDFGAASFDCPHVRDQLTMTHTLGSIAASTEPQSVVLSTDSPPCIGVSGTPCFCATCNTLAAEACSSNADCPPSGGNPGICGGRRCLGGANGGTPCTAASECPGGFCTRPGEPSEPNACLDDTTTTNDCAPIGGGRGECTAGPVDNQCTNHPNRGCLADDDCDDVPGACGTHHRYCFLDQGVLGGSVAVSGTATPPVAGVSEPTDLGSLACIRSGNSGFQNSAAGLPGLARTRQPGRLIFDPVDVPLQTSTPSETATPLQPATPTPTPVSTPNGSSCPPAPDACRTSLFPRKSIVQITDRADDPRDRLAWQWSRGAATTVAELGEPGGDPTTTTAYDLCVYDASGLRATVYVPSGGTCPTKPCWRALPNGFTYRNSAGGPHGVTSLSLRASPTDKAQVKLKGAGGALPLPPLASLAGTIEVQLRNRSTGLCFGTTFVPPFEKLTTEQLKDHAD